MSFNQYNSLVHKKNLDENLILLEQLWVEMTDNDFNIKDILKQISSKKLKLLHETNIIKSKDEIIDIKEIINLNLNNIQVFFKIINENELLTYINSKNIGYFYDIIKNINSSQFRTYIEWLWKNNFVKLLEQWNENFLKWNDLDTYLREDNLPIFYKNKLVTDNRTIENPYLSKQIISTISKVFSIINQNSNSNINSNTRAWFLHEDMDWRSFYDVNNKNEEDIWISKEKQLILNRIFAPFINSTNLIEITWNNWWKKIVSIDVENKNFQDIDTIKNWWLNDNILMLQSLIYQFITLDSDRDLSKNDETSNYIDKILIDFDRIWIDKKKNWNFYDLENENYKEKFNLSDNDLEIIIDIITFFKWYIILLANEKLETNQKNAAMWKNLKYRAQKMNWLNIFLTWFYSIWNQDIQKIVNIDKEIIKKYEDN